MLDIYIKKITIHQFSPNDTELFLSEGLVNITPRIDEYFRKKLAKVFQMMQSVVSLKMIIFLES